MMRVILELNDLPDRGCAERETVRVLMGHGVVDDKRSGLGVETHDVAARVVHLGGDEHQHMGQGVRGQRSLVGDVGGADRQGGREGLLAKRAP